MPIAAPLMEVELPTSALLMEVRLHIAAPLMEVELHIAAPLMEVEFPTPSPLRLRWPWLRLLWLTAQAAWSTTSLGYLLSSDEVSPRARTNGLRVCSTRNSWLPHRLTFVLLFGQRARLAIGSCRFVLGRGWSGHWLRITSRVLRRKGRLQQIAL